MKQKQYTDEEINAEWRRMLAEFHEIIKGDTSTKQAKDSLLDLKLRAKENRIMTDRQTQAITARVDNVIAGTYGNSKVASNFGHTKGDLKPKQETK